MQEEKEISKKRTATQRFFSWGMILPFAVGIVVGASVVSWIPRLRGEKEVLKLHKTGEQDARNGFLLARISQLADNHEWQTLADFEKQFEGSQITQLSPGIRFPGSLPLSFETEKYLAVVLWKEAPAFIKPAPLPDPKGWSDPNFRIVRNADGSVQRNPDGSIRLEAASEKPGAVTWSPRRNEDGSYSLKEDVRTPADKIWYLLAAFNKLNNQCAWWGVFVEKL